MDVLHGRGRAPRWDDGVGLGEGIASPVLPGAAVVPGVPGAVRLVGREEDLRALERIRTAPVAGRAGTGRVVVVCGPGGVGKSALVAMWLRHLAAAGALPGGVFSVRLAPGTDTGDVLGGLLRQVAGWVPDDPGERAALWRAATAGRRLAVCVDVHGPSSQGVGDLVPGAGCLMVVTCRSAPQDLERAGVHRLPGLTDSHIGAWLREMLPPGRNGTAASLASLAGLAVACRGLPLVAGLAAGVLDTSSSPASWRPQDLADEILPPPLTHPNGRAARPAQANRETISRALDCAYRALALRDTGAAACYRRLGLLPPGVVFDAAVVAAVAGVDAEMAAGHLDTLADCSLVEAAGDDVFALGEAVREHAARICRAVDSEQDRDAALVRYLTHLADTLTGPGPVAGAVREAPTRPAALAAAVEEAARVCLDGLVVALVRAARPVWRACGAWQASFAAHQAALLAARRLRDRGEEIAVLRELGVVLAGAGREQEALTSLAAAAAAADRDGHASVLAGALHDLGRLYSRLGRTCDAEEVLRQAVTLREVALDREGAARSRMELARTALRRPGPLGVERAARLEDVLKQARAVLGPVAPLDAAHALALQGEVAARSGSPGAGVRHLVGAGEEFAAAGRADWKARCLAEAARIAAADGRGESAEMLIGEARRSAPGLVLPDAFQPAGPLSPGCGADGGRGAGSAR